MFYSYKDSDLTTIHENSNNEVSGADSGQYDNQNEIPDMLEDFKKMRSQSAKNGKKENHDTKSLNHSKSYHIHK
jgi:hypothetical protein